MSLHTSYFVTQSVQAARHIPGALAGSRLQGLHGHSFGARLSCELPNGWGEFPGAELTQLQALLAQALEPWDYSLLNTYVAEPTDENLVRALHDALQKKLPMPVRASWRSTPEQGVLWTAESSSVLWRRYAFEAAHHLPHVPTGHKCGRMHGHSFQVSLRVRREAGEDEALLDRVWARYHAQLHHACLNDIAGLENPTSEMLSSWLWQQLQAVLPGLLSVAVYETASCGARFDGQRYVIWKDTTLDSAIKLRHAPCDHPLSRLHGHSYGLRLHLSAPLDQVMGWTVDFGDVKERFTPVFQALDHRPLYEIADLAECDAASLAHWIWQKTQAELPQLVRVDVQERPGQGVTVESAP